jgi:hypothetical protein
MKNINKVLLLYSSEIFIEYDAIERNARFLNCKKNEISIVDFSNIRVCALYVFF